MRWKSKKIIKYVDQHGGVVAVHLPAGGCEKTYRDNLFIANFLKSTEFITLRLF